MPRKTKKDAEGFGVFTCAGCGGTYPSDRPIEEAVTEAEDRFGPMAQHERALVCEPCYEIIVREPEPRRLN